MYFPQWQPLRSGFPWFIRSKQSQISDIFVGYGLDNCQNTDLNWAEPNLQTTNPPTAYHAAFLIDQHFETSPQVTLLISRPRFDVSIMANPTPEQEKPWSNEEDQAEQRRLAGEYNPSFEAGSVT